MRWTAKSALFGLLIAGMPAWTAQAATDPACLAIEPGDDDSPIIRATINDHGPFAFVLDTAASGSTIDPSLAATLGLPRDSLTEEAQGMGGGIEVHFHRLRSMRAGPVMLEDAPVPALPAPEFESHSVAGLAGVDLLGDRLTVWLPGTGCVRIAPSGDRPGAEGWKRVPAKWLQPWKIMLPLKIGTASGWALLDTGAQHTTLNPAFARQVGLESNRLRPSGSISGVDGRELPLSEGAIANISIGPWRWDRRKVRVGALPVFDRLDGAGQLLAILGMDWLASEGFAVDYGRQEVWLQERDPG